MIRVRPLALGWRGTTGWALGAAMAAAPWACVSDGHPLGTDGRVEVRVSVDGPLFATDELDEAGQATGPRQTPFSSDVVLRITEEDEVGHGAFVQVRVEPAEALVLGAALAGDAEGATSEDGEPTCSLVDGAFRCRGNTEGFARFSVTAAGDWSGDAQLIVSWANQIKEQVITVLPAGLPDDATNFQLLGIGDEDRVPATFLALACTVDSLPEDLGSKWPEGRIRAREAVVRATAPAANPSAVEHAPVTIETLSGEGALSTSAECVERKTRLRVLLDATGESPPFFLCFSDIGGEIDFAVTSSAKTITPPPSITIDPEPRILRVRVLDGQSNIETSFVPEPLFEVSAYDVSLSALALDVDLSVDSSPAGVLSLNEGSITLAPEGAAAAVVSGVPNIDGTANLVVTPRLLASPMCSSGTVTVFTP